MRNSTPHRNTTCASHRHIIAHSYAITHGHTVAYGDPIAHRNSNADTGSSANGDACSAFRNAYAHPSPAYSNSHPATCIDAASNADHARW